MPSHLTKGVGAKAGTECVDAIACYFSARELKIKRADPEQAIYQQAKSPRHRYSQHCLENTLSLEMTTETFISASSSIEPWSTNFPLRIINRKQHTQNHVRDEIVVELSELFLNLLSTSSFYLIFTAASSSNSIHHQSTAAPSISSSTNFDNVDSSSDRTTTT